MTIEVQIPTSAFGRQKVIERLVINHEGRFLIAARWNGNERAQRSQNVVAFPFDVLEKLFEEERRLLFEMAVSDDAYPHGRKVWLGTTMYDVCVQSIQHREWILPPAILPLQPHDVVQLSLGNASPDVSNDGGGNNELP